MLWWDQGLFFIAKKDGLNIRLFHGSFRGDPSRGYAMKLAVDTFNKEEAS